MLMAAITISMLHLDKVQIFINLEVHHLLFFESLIALNSIIVLNCLIFCQMLEDFLQFYRFGDIVVKGLCLLDFFYFLLYVQVIPCDSFLDVLHHSRQVFNAIMTLHQAHTTELFNCGGIVHRLLQERWA